MQPRIKCAKTSDGVNIGFWSLGEGVPVVLMPNPPFQHIGMDLPWPHVRGTYENRQDEREGALAKCFAKPRASS